MTISVVIPAYNEEKYLPWTIESIKKLDRKPDEIVVVDGGSTDKTAASARQHGATVITVAHRGIGFARQMGLQKAAGDICAFTDADTIVPHDWLNRIERSLSGVGVAATYGRYVVTKESSHGLFYIYFINWFNPFLFRVSSWFGLHLPGGQNIAFWRKKGIEAGGFPVDFKSVEDYEMMRRLSKVGKIVYDTKNTVLSSGRRAKEGAAMITRSIKGMTRYFLTGKADTFGFPDIR